MQTQTKQVQFTDANVEKCQCLNCPVQASSQCAMDRGRELQNGQSQLSPQDVPKVYCSTGQSTCDELDYSANCICPTCAVWAENGLESYKYCRDGDAAKIG